MGSAPSKQSQNSDKLRPSSRIRRLTIKQKKNVKKSSVRIVGSFKLFARSCRHLWQHKLFFGKLLLVYALLYVVLVKGLATNFQLSQTRDAISTTVDGGFSNLEMASALFGTLLGTAGTASSESAGVYQILLFVIVSLAIIWGLRQTVAKRSNLKLRDAFYGGTAQFVPYVLVLSILFLQLIPAFIGIVIYSIVDSNGLAVGFLERAVWIIILVAFLGASAFMLSASIFATYIVALPQTSPVFALRSAHKLVRFHRWAVLRKVLFLPVIILLIMALLFMPLVLLAPMVAEVTFLIFMLLLVLLSHTYLYFLYRELIQ